MAESSPSIWRWPMLAEADVRHFTVPRGFARTHNNARNPSVLGIFEASAVSSGLICSRNTTQLIRMYTVCHLPTRSGRPRHLLPCSATYKMAFNTCRFDSFTFPRWVGKQCATRSYCCCVISIPQPYAKPTQKREHPLDRYCHAKPTACPKKWSRNWRMRKVIRVLCGLARSCGSGNPAAVADSSPAEDSTTVETPRGYNQGDN